MAFYRTLDGDYINAAHIVTIKRTSTQEHLQYEREKQCRMPYFCVAKTISNESYMISADTADAIHRNEK